MTPVWCMVPTMDMKRDRYGTWQTELFVILDHFLHFSFTKALKKINFKQMKQMHEAIIILCKCTKHHDHMPYCSWDMVHDGCNFHFHFGLFFALLPPIDPKIKIKKKKKLPEDVILHICTVPEKWCTTTG